MIIAELKLFCEQNAGKMVKGEGITVVAHPGRSINYVKHKKMGHIIGYSNDLKNNNYSVIICSNDSGKMKCDHKKYDGVKYEDDIYLLENLMFSYYIDFDTIKIIEASKNELLTLIKMLEL